MLDHGLSSGLADAGADEPFFDGFDPVGHAEGFVGGDGFGGVHGGRSLVVAQVFEFGALLVRIGVGARRLFDLGGAGEAVIGPGKRAFVFAFGQTDERHIAGGGDEAVGVALLLVVVPGREEGFEGFLVARQVVFGFANGARGMGDPPLSQIAVGLPEAQTFLQQLQGSGVIAVAHADAAEVAQCQRLEVDIAEFLGNFNTFLNHFTGMGALGFIHV